MSFNIALTGLNAVNQYLNAVSHNIANSATTGFKSSRAEFASLYSSGQPMGVEVQAVTQSISLRGSINASGRDLDLAIGGGGFFITRSAGGETRYTRAGMFGTDEQGYLTAGGGRLQGYPVDAAGVLQAGGLGDLQQKTGNLPAQASNRVDFAANLDANATPPKVTPFDPSNPDTYTCTQTTPVYDSQGKKHSFTQYFINTGSNQWDVRYFVDGAGVGPAQPLSFSTSGTLAAPVGPVTITHPLPGVEPLNLALSYAGSTQYGSPFVIGTNRANGYATGERTGMAVEKDGRLYATFSNGQRLLEGQLVLAGFTNPGGLANQNGTSWSETSASGTPLLGTPNSGQFGPISSKALEGSNVDLTRELVGLMEGQRNYQANTKVVSTNKDLIQALFAAV
ncbi:flagellar hook protein FlgE [Metapseudomonas otitidis]|uniref:flagellar hook protein FlgE n=1 Tax=Metapseudomonas otitidis TaxID=319939 RepID=UPI002541F4B8|nr:flagellar hook protein FlgE [Pseudomonas otitidis]WIF65334.1 flagellar hook protein FlgE [Pseudomonas otitidis]